MGTTRKQRETSDINMRQGRPLNPLAERLALGGMMSDPGTYFEAYADRLTPDDFSEPRHRAIYAAFLGIRERGEEMLDKGAVIDFAAVAEELKRMGELADVGMSYVSSLTTEVIDTYTTASHIRTVFENSCARRRQNIGYWLDRGSKANIYGREEPYGIADGMRDLAALEQRIQLFDNPEGLARVAGITLLDVQTQAVRWLWQRRIARGKLALIDGDPGLGKGFLTLDLAARITRGDPLPGDTQRREPASVILITPEDDPADTIRPRMEAAGADLRRVHVIETVPDVDLKTGKRVERPISVPRDVARIEEAIRHYGAELVIVDPIMGCLDAGVKTGIDADVRAALMPLKMVAQQTGAAIVMVRHLNKSGGDNAVYRGGGSVGFVALCRTTFLVAEHPDNADKRILAPVKSNIAKAAPALSFALVSRDPDGYPHVSWDVEPCEYHANELLGTRKSQERRDVVRILREAGEPLSLQRIAALCEPPIAEHDDKAQAALRQRLSRMVREGEAISPSRGVYAHKSLSHTSQVSRQSQVSQVSQGIVTDVTDVTAGRNVTPAADTYQRPLADVQYPEGGIA